jgi:glycosyltransferase involved in cell wall biosynthesis
MIEKNPQKIQKADLVVGLPSYNEADNIGKVIKKVDQGLSKYFNSKKSVIINADNNSVDQTGRVFLSTKTKNPKIYISTPPGVKGKGHNLYNVFNKVRELKALGGMLVDADMRSVRPEWVKCLLGPIFKGYDYVSPVYYRDRFDGSITNHFCFPLIYGLLGYNIRQPIGGEVGFSNKMAGHWLSQNWSEDAKLFGVDIFMFFNVIKGGFNLCRADLGERMHSPSLPKLDFMFFEVANTFFRLLSENRNLWQKRNIKVRELPLLCRIKQDDNYPKLTLEIELLQEKARIDFEAHFRELENFLQPPIKEKLEEILISKKEIFIDGEFWSKLVYQMLSIYQKNKDSKDREKIIKFLRGLYFARFASALKKDAGKDPKKLEKIFLEQAKIFYKNRNYLIDNI